MKSTVTIITPVFNAAPLLKQGINSVFSQSWPVWQWIIVNDGSQDRTAQLLAGISDRRIQVLHQENLGVSAARNAGLEIATGDYITFLDADDTLPPRSLEARASFLDANPDVDMIDGIVSVRDEHMETELRRYEPYYSGPLLPQLLKLDSSVFFNVCYMFRRSALGTTRFPEHMTHAEDLAFFMMLADRGDLRYGHVDEEVYRYRSGRASAMSNMDGLESGYLELLKIARSLRSASRAELVSLRRRIARILMLSWASKGHALRGLRSATKTLFN